MLAAQLFDHFALSSPHARPLNEMVRSGLPEAIFHKDMDAILSVGGIDAGTQFHKHADGFSVLVHGHKRWFLSASDSMPLVTTQATPLWLAIFRTFLRDCLRFPDF